MGSLVPERQTSSSDRVGAVRRNAELAARELQAERADSVLELARTFGAIDRGEDAARLEARLSFLERQVDRLVSRRDQGLGAVQSDLAMLRARIDAALEAVAACAEDRRRDRLEVREELAACLDQAEERLAGAARALKAELDERAAVVEGMLAEIRDAMSAHLTATVRAAQALLESPVGRAGERSGVAATGERPL